MAPFRPQSVKSVLTHVAIGMGSASFWRGAWYVLDDHLFPDSPEKSALASLGLGTLGMAASQGIIGRVEALGKQLASHSPPNRALSTISVLRFGALYTIAFSCVLVWRGTWIGWDCVYDRMHTPKNTTSKQEQPLHSNRTDTASEPGHATKSGLLSHSVAVGILLGTGFFASVLAPPAAVSVIRDWTIKAGARPYTGPAQAVARHFFAPRVTPMATTTTSLSRPIHNTYPQS